MSKLKELREKRAAIHAQATEELKKEQTAETRLTIAKMFTDIDALGVDIQNIERADREEAALRGSLVTAPAGDPSAKTVEQRHAEYRKAWVDHLRNGDKPTSHSRGLSEESRRIMAEMRAWIESQPEYRALGEGALIPHIGTYTGLGFFVPTGFVNDIEVALKYYAPLMDGTVIEILDTATGQPLPYPTSNDTTQAATIVGEAGVVAEQDVTASHVILGAWKYTTGLVKVSLELLQDSAFNLDTFLAQRFAERLGRGYERDFTVGDGVNKPTGIVTDVAASGAVPITAVGSSETSGGAETGASSIGYTDLVRLEHSVDPSYRRNGKFMMHDQTLSRLKRIIDKFGRPLWTPGMKDGAPDTINGYPYVINQSVAQIAVSATTVVFGDLKKFLVRRVKDLMVMRLEERFADAGQIAFVAFARADSRLIDAGTHPVNVLKQST